MAVEEKIRTGWKAEQLGIGVPVVAVIGAAGQTGELFARTLGKSGNIQVEAVVRRLRWRDELLHPEVGFHPSIEAMLVTKPDAVILATQNPTKEALKKIAKHVQRPTILILPQNGVDVVSTAEEVLANVRENIGMVRACLYTTVSRDQNGDVVYNEGKKRIALAPVNDKESLERVRELFIRAGFDLRVEDEHDRMAWTKLVAANLFGATSMVTFLAPRDSLRDKDIFALEHKALQDRLKILEKAGIKLADLWGIGKLRLLAKLPTPVAVIFRGFIADQFSKERNNQPPAAARQIKEGARKVEPTRYYHRPMVKLGEENGLESPVDAALWEILKRHERGDNFSLVDLSVAERRKLLFDIVGLESRKLFVDSSLPITMAAEAIHGFLTQGFTVSGRENLRPAGESLRSGKSVLFVFNHRSHADHPTVVKALRKEFPEFSQSPFYIVANMIFDKERLSHWLNRSYPHPLVATLKGGARDEEETKWRAQIINRRSSKIIQQLLSRPSIFILYPEGTRSPDGKVGEAALGASTWLLMSQFDLVIPGAINGTGIMFPPRTHSLHRADISVEFGEPIKVSDLQAEANKVSWRERDRHVSQIVMGRVKQALHSDYSK